jgi:hypothetical protein
LLARMWSSKVNICCEYSRAGAKRLLFRVESGK